MTFTLNRVAAPNHVGVVVLDQALCLLSSHRHGYTTSGSGLQHHRQANVE
jgi:hypothetical protein